MNLTQTHDPMQSLVNGLCKMFNVPRVEVLITHKDRSYFDPNYYNKPIIFVSLSQDLQECFLDVCVHEFAHYLHFRRFPHTPLVHSSLFWKILNAIIMRAYPLPSLYSWDREYIIGQKFAKRMGYIKNINRKY